MPELPPDYYLQNFCCVLDLVEDQYRDLLSEAESDFVKKFRDLDCEAKMLLVRMLCRSRDVFRRQKLQYREISDVDLALDRLLNVGLVKKVLPTQVDLLIPLFSKSEWCQKLSPLPIDTAILNGLKVKTRPELDRWLAENVHAIPHGESELVVQLAVQDIFTVLKLLFFGNLHQDLSEFVVQDLGLIRYPNYQICAESRMFNSRRQINSYIDYYRLLDSISLDVGKEGVASLVELNDWIERLSEIEAGDSILARRLDRTKLTLARQVERAGELHSALASYEKVIRPPARERRARILAKLDRQQESLDLCREILEKSHSDEERGFASQFGHRLAKRMGQSWDDIETYRPEEERVSLDNCGESVEECAAGYFRARGLHCAVVENALFLGVFGLFYWDLLYAAVPGAFTHPFQLRAHDLYEDDFLVRRASLFCALEKDLVQRMPLARLIDTFRRHRGEANAFVDWRALDEDLLSRACTVIPLSHWRAVFTRLWSNLKENRSGFPDLIVFDREASYTLVEVKAPNDKLQKNQQRWMEYFSQYNIPHRVLHVNWQ